ncbi:hypothetical protein [Vibrio harveyi]|uniref:hypothetical protein n=1 Tax=Vibrio harveyi TaxID=669 RepID=UPI00165EB765|nr:hypothetical protein [Vibrio harveyi]
MAYCPSIASLNWSLVAGRWSLVAGRDGAWRQKEQSLHPLKSDEDDNGREQQQAAQAH